MGIGEYVSGGGLLFPASGIDMASRLACSAKAKAQLSVLNVSLTDAETVNAELTVNRCTLLYELL